MTSHNKVQNRHFIKKVAVTFVCRFDLFGNILHAEMQDEKLNAILRWVIFILLFVRKCKENE